LLDQGYTLSGWTCGMLAVVEEPSAARGAVLAEVARRIPARQIGMLARFVAALCGADADRLLAVADEHADAGYVWSATIAYQYAIAWLRLGGAAVRAGQVREDARRRLAPWGDEAVAGLRTAADGAELTAREDEIARLAASGLTNQDIAKRLLISVRTVENHLHRVFRKLGVESRAELARALA
jgi:DNA-binding CsgD family transcriptional regulator